MGTNAIVLGKNVTTNAVENIQSTNQALHITSPFDMGMVGNFNYGPTNRQRGFVFGRRTLVQNTIVDLWDGPTDRYVFPTVAQQMMVVSSSASDAAAGTGIRKVRIHYLDDNYDTQEEEVTLNGTTPVNTVATNILRINIVHASEVGSNQVSVGNISVKNTGNTITYSYLAAGWNISRQAVYTIPRGVTGYITHWQASSGSTGNHFCTTTVRATTHDGEQFPGVFLVQDETGTQNGGISINFPTPIPIMERSDVKISAISDAVNANVIAIGAIMGYFETNI